MRDFALHPDDVARTDRFDPFAQNHLARSANHYHEVLMPVHFERCEPAGRHFEIANLEIGVGLFEKILTADASMGALDILVGQNVEPFPKSVDVSKNQSNITIALTISPRFIASYAAGKSRIPMKSLTTCSARTVPARSHRSASAVSSGPHE